MVSFTHIGLSPCMVGTTLMANTPITSLPKKFAGHVFEEICILTIYPVSESSNVRGSVYGSASRCPEADLTLLCLAYLVLWLLFCRHTKNHIGFLATMNVSFVLFGAASNAKTFSKSTRNSHSCLSFSSTFDSEVLSRCTHFLQRANIYQFFSFFLCYFTACCFTGAEAPVAHVIKSFCVIYLFCMLFWPKAFQVSAIWHHSTPMISLHAWNSAAFGRKLLNNSFTLFPTYVCVVHILNHLSLPLSCTFSDLDTQLYPC